MSYTEETMNQPLKTTVRTAAAAIVLAFLTLPAWSADDAGKMAFLEEKCDKCHPIASHAIERTITSEKMWGPDLGGIGSTRDAEWLQKWEMKEIEVDGKKHKSTYKGTKKNLASIIAWLVEQKAETSD